MSSYPDFTDQALMLSIRNSVHDIQSQTENIQSQVLQRKFAIQHRLNEFHRNQELIRKEIAQHQFDASNITRQINMAQNQLDLWTSQLMAVTNDLKRCQSDQPFNPLPGLQQRYNQLKAYINENNDLLVELKKKQAETQNDILQLTDMWEMELSPSPPANDYKTFSYDTVLKRICKLDDVEFPQVIRNNVALLYDMPYELKNSNKNAFCEYIMGQNSVVHKFQNKGPQDEIIPAPFLFYGFIDGKREGLNIITLFKKDNYLQQLNENERRRAYANLRKIAVKLGDVPLQKRIDEILQNLEIKD